MINCVITQRAQCVYRYILIPRLGASDAERLLNLRKYIAYIVNTCVTANLINKS